MFSKAKEKIWRGGEEVKRAGSGGEMKGKWRRCEEKRWRENEGDAAKGEEEKRLERERRKIFFFFYYR